MALFLCGAIVHHLVYVTEAALVHCGSQRKPGQLQATGESDFGNHSWCAFLLALLGSFVHLYGCRGTLTAVGGRAKLTPGEMP